MNWKKHNLHVNNRKKLLERTGERNPGFAVRHSIQVRIHMPVPYLFPFFLVTFEISFRSQEAIRQYMEVCGMRRVLISLFFVLIIPLSTQSQSSKPAETKWDVSAKHGPTTDVEFETSEGTWMAVDVSPDGKWTLFDLVGDIYIMPSTGGEANPFTGRIKDGAPAQRP